MLQHSVSSICVSCSCAAETAALTCSKAPPPLLACLVWTSNSDTLRLLWEFWPEPLQVWEAPRVTHHLTGCTAATLVTTREQAGVAEQQHWHCTQTGCHAPVVAKRQKNPGSVFRRISPQRIMLARYCSLYGPGLSSWSRSSPCSCSRSRTRMSRPQQRRHGVAGIHATWAYCCLRGPDRRRTQHSAGPRLHKDTVTWPSANTPFLNHKSMKSLQKAENDPDFGSLSESWCRCY